MFKPPFDTDTQRLTCTEEGCIASTLLEGADAGWLLMVLFEVCYPNGEGQKMHIGSKAAFCPDHADKFFNLMEDQDAESS